MEWKNRIVEFGVKTADQFQAHPLNARTHPQQQRNAVRGSLNTLGWIGPVIVNRRPNGEEVLIDGHERIWQALQNNNADVPFVVVELSENEERLALTSYDFITQMAEYDKEVLDELLREVNTTNSDMQSLLAEIAEAEGLFLDSVEPVTEDDFDADDAFDRVAELQEKWGTEQGQIWEVVSEDGERVHRVMCGDSKEEGAREILFDEAKVATCITDPPYGIGFDTDYTRFVGGVSENRNHGKKIEGDAEPFDPSPYLTFPEVVMWGANCFSDRLPLGSWLIWDKRFDNGEAFLADAEAAWSNGGYGIYIKHVTSQGFVRPERVEHPTQKPVAIMAWCIERCKGERIYDPFLGSGTTLIAADQLGRTCYGMEIDPGYVAVILERCEQAGMTPHLTTTP